MTAVVDLRRPGWKKTQRSSRHLVFRHGRRQLRKLQATELGGSSSTPAVGPVLSLGEEQIFSSYVPGLEAGLHTICAKQDIVADGQTLCKTTTHLFNVIAPRFALPDNAVDSFYPPRGHADRAEVVPHMVFNDPTLPWERTASTIFADDDATNTVPWLAVLLFTQDELRLSSSDLSTMFAATSLGTTAKQSSTLTINMLASEILDVKNSASGVVYDPEGDGADAKTDLIFVPSVLFNPIFTQYDGQGQPKPGQKNGWVHHHRFLSHLRHIHLDGTATAATTDDEDHTYSVVVGHRTGPLDITQPTTVVAHLVNIEGVEGMGWPVTQSYVAMSSLYSWDYTCLPPKSLNVADAFAQLGTSLNVLRPGLTQDDVKALQAAGAVGNRLNSRLNDGFSMVRYRTQTGEVSSAFFRGPFTPNTVTFPATEKPPWPAASTTGQKLQILDQQLNLMDLTYSAAWNLGKTLALADQTFAAALSRVRSQILDVAMKEAQESVIKAWAADLGIPSPYRTREDMVSTIAETIKRVRELPGSKLLQRDPNGMVRRWFRPEHPRLDLTYHGSEIDPIIDQYLASAAAIVASTTDGNGCSATPPTPYNEFNVPYSPDWAVVLKWAMDRYFLVNVPPHYLISNASHLPTESLRFFNIDPAWVWAMVDGGLSLANHLDQSDDRLRDAIKGAIKTYLNTQIPGHGYVPPVPTYGFFLRSALVTKFPDMIVDLTGTDKSDTKGPPEILRHEILGQDVLLGLLRAAPASPNFTSLLLREPPHQQYFAAAADITAHTIEMDYQRVYTDPKANDPDRNKTVPYTDTRGGPSQPRGVNYIWGTTPTSTDVRILNVENYAGDVQKQLVKLFHSNPTWYTAPYASAALMGIEMNEPCWQLEVQLPYVDTAPSSISTESLTPSSASGHHQSPGVLLPLPPKRQHPPRKKATFPSHPEIACAPHPTFTDRTRTRTIPLQQRHPAPHTRLPRPGPLTPPARPAAPSNVVGGGTPSGPPQFNYLLYPAGSAASGQSQIPMLPNSAKQDLVFSVVLTPGTGQDFQLTSLTFSVPLAPPRPLIAEGCDYRFSGGGVTMLANMRFVAVAQFSLDGTTLVLTVKPRSVSGSWPAAHVDEVSFLLSGVVVQTYDGPTSVDVPVVESYRPDRAFSHDLFVELVPPPGKPGG